MTPRSRFRLGWMLIALIAVRPIAARADGVRFLQAELTPERASTLAMSPDGKHLYVSGADSHSLSVHSVGPTGALTSLETYPSVEDATSVAVSGDGKHVYVTVRGGTDGALVVLQRNDDEMSTDFGKLTSLQVLTDADLPVANTMEKPQAVIVSPVDDAHVYVVNNKSKSLVAFTRTTDTMSADFGKLTFLEAQQQSPGGCDPMGAGICGLNDARFLAFAPDGDSLYVAGNKGDTKAGTVTVFARDTDGLSPTYGKLTIKQTIRNLEDGITSLHHPSGIAVSGDGKNVYVSSPGGKAVHVFARNASDGTLTFVEFQKDGGDTKGLNGASGVALDSNGKYVFATASKDEALSVFRRDATTGALTILETQFNVADFSAPLHDLVSPQEVIVGTDDKHVYVAAAGGRLVVFTIDECGDGTRGVDEECDDGDLVNGNGCSDTCTIERCGTLPADHCTVLHTTAPEQASLDIKNDPAADDAKDAVSWKWSKGTIAKGDFGDPRATADYVLCVYDADGMATQPRLKVVAPRGLDDNCKGGDHCWKTSPGPSKNTPHVAVGNVGKFQYGDKSLLPNGVQSLKLQAGTGNASLKLKGKGVRVQAPVLGSGLGTPVVAVLKNTENGECWQATYTAPTFNNNVEFKSVNSN